MQNFATTQGTPTAQGDDNAPTAQRERVMTWQGGAGFILLASSGLWSVLGFAIVLGLRD